MAKGQLNDAFERVAKAAEKRLAAEGQKQLRLVEGVGRKIRSEVSQALQKALKDAIANVEKLADDLRIEDEGDRRDLRRGLETVNGLVTGAKKGAALGAVLGPKGAALGGVIGGALGGLVSQSLDDVRRQLDAVRAQVERDRIATQRALDGFQRESERFAAARRRTGRLG